MNRLKNTRCYLCGAMGLAADNGVLWREEVGSMLKELGVTVLDPCDKPIDIGIEDIESKDRRAQFKKLGFWDELTKDMKTIRCVDLRMVDISDFLIVNVDLDTYTVGTWEEVTLANRQKKPIIVHVEQGKINCPDWLFGMLPHQLIFDTWHGVTEYLVGINCGRITETYKRWYFFDLYNYFGKAEQ